MFLKAAFVPQPERMDDTSYFVSRYNSNGMEIDETSVDSDSDCSEVHANSGLEVKYIAHNCFLLSYSNSIKFACFELERKWQVLITYEFFFLCISLCPCWLYLLTFIWWLILFMVVRGVPCWPLIPSWEILWSSSILIPLSQLIFCWMIILNEFCPTLESW